MRILVTGANGYIGTRLIPLLLEQGHQVVALIRNVQRFNLKDPRLETVQVDLLQSHTLPQDIDAAYYLVHAMSDDPDLFTERDRQSSTNFANAISKTDCKQIIYLSGLASEAELSKHLSSRLEVEEILKKSGVPTTCIRSSIIIGAGSASFEMIRDLVEKLPILVTPLWVSNECQPIAIKDVLEYLTGILGKEEALDRTFEIGGPEAISYEDMLKRFAKKRGLKRILIPVPVLTPKISSYWLIFITSTNYYLARSLIDSLRSDSVQTDFSIQEIVPKECFTYEEAIDRAFQKIQQNAVVSSWRDSWVASDLPTEYKKYIEVPKLGCFSHTTLFPFTGDPDQVMESVFQMGGKNGYYMDWTWKIRGLIDRTFGGVGLRRGKTARGKPRAGDALDFWRVLLADETNRRFLLYAEMKVPGEAWLELRIEPKDDHHVLHQVATFRPKGVWGRLYWVVLYPIHVLIFKGMGKKLIEQGGGKIKGSVD